MAEVQFLFDNQLIAALETLIKSSKNHLLLISPFIDLDRRIQDALLEKIEKHDFELKVLFGKNEDNYFKSIKKNSLDFLKKFPNVEIRYNDRLHAKFYQNDFDFIMTSLNLYDYSLAKNIEVGILGNFASKGLIGKVINGTNTLVNQGIDKVGQDIFGVGLDVNPIEKFETIFKNSELKYKTEPKIINAEGFNGMIGRKTLDGHTVLIDNLNSEAKSSKISTFEKVANKGIDVKSKPEDKVSGNTKSASQISKLFGVPLIEITDLMQNYGFIQGDKITSLGLSKGLVMKNYMGKEYIAYPENLKELNDLK